jgi:predicted transcriptional regulator
MEQLKINNGFVKLPRTILEWEWYDHPDVFRIYIHLLIKVNYAPARWRGIDILEGEHITSTGKLSMELNMSEFKVRESLLKLEKTGFLKKTTTNKFTKLKLLQYGADANNTDLKLKPNAVQTPDKVQSKQNQTTTKKNNKENKEVEERKEVFKNEILRFSNTFSKQHLDGFYKYWTTEHQETGRLKFEAEKNWDLESKIKSWVVFPKPKEKKTCTKNRP